MRDLPTRAPSTAEVHGTVTDAAGRPVADAAVEVVAVATDAGGGARVGDCVGAPGPSARARTGADGAYRVTLSAGAGPQMAACLAVRVEPPPGRGLAPKLVSGPTAVLRSDRPERVRVDVALADA